MTARKNNSSEGSLFTSSILATGAFRKVYLGEYTKGERIGENCVGKVFKDRAVFETDYFRNDISVVTETIKIVEKWNSAKFINQTIRVNEPEVWKSLTDNQKILVEPFIAQWEKFNSNTGWVSGSQPWQLVMQALSHYSYHISGGNLVICDLQGGLYKNGAILTDPVVLSRTRQYGPTDLGVNGISSFFSQHECNKFCKNNWSKPKDRKQYFIPSSGTSMVLTAGHGLTLHNRDTMDLR